MSAGQLARRLFCSESTLRRRLRKHGTTFVRERNVIRAQDAFEFLAQGHSAEATARRVGVTRDYLRVIMLQGYGYAPRKLGRIVELARRLMDEPQTLRAVEAAKRDDLALQELLGEIGPNHPLSGWAKGLVTLGYHPERDTPEYLEELRNRERAAYIRRQHREDAQAVMGLSIDDLHEVDVPYLLEVKRSSKQHMHMTANKRRRAGRSAGMPR